MLVSLDHPILLKLIETLQRRYWYTHHLWGRCHRRIQDALDQRRQAGSTHIDIDEIMAVLDWTIDAVDDETLYESDIIYIAQLTVDNNDRIRPDAFYVDRLLKQFGIDAEAIPAPEGERYISPLGLGWWREIFLPSTFHKRLDAAVFGLFERLHELLGFQCIARALGDDFLTPTSSSYQDRCQHNVTNYFVSNAFSRYFS